MTDGCPRVLGTVTVLPPAGSPGTVESAVVIPVDPAVFFEGFCPNCRVPLDGRPRTWCPRCRAFWNAVPQEPGP